MTMNAWQKDFLAKKHCNTIKGGGGDDNEKSKKYYTLYNAAPKICKESKLLFCFSFRDYNWFWVPFVGPHLGAILGALMYLLCIGIHLEKRKKQRSVRKTCR